MISSVKRVCICAVCIALCCVLPVAFHALALGTAFSPIHIPVLLCGLVCGGAYGAFCGLAGPILSCLITGMPPAMGLISMVPELVVYGLVCGLLMRYIRTGKHLADCYLALIPAMVAGRLVGGVAKVLFHLGSPESLTFAALVQSYVVASLPGIVVHLILVPVLAVTLEKAKAVPARYPKVKQE